MINKEKVLAKVKYVDNKRLLEVLKEYKKACREAEDMGEEYPKIPDYVGECLFKIATKLANRPNFYSYSYRDDMISDGLESAIQWGVRGFDPEKSSNPFAYFTQVIWYAFLRRIEREKKQLYIKHKVTENSMILGTIVEKNDGDFGDSSFEVDTDYMNDFVESFEKRLENKSKKTAFRKAKKVGLEHLYEE